MLEIKILPLLSSGIDCLGYKLPVLRVNSFEYPFQCRVGCCFEFEYPKRFLGPIIFSRSTRASQSCLCGLASELPPGRPHSAATGPQSACARSRLWPHLTPSVPETAFSNCATQETYSVSIPIGLATSIIDRAQMPDQAYPRNDDTFRSGFYPWEAAAAKRVSGRRNFELT